MIIGLIVAGSILGWLASALVTAVITAKVTKDDIYSDDDLVQISMISLVLWPLLLGILLLLGIARGAAKIVRGLI